jgi:5-(carboxyamino)imidazole ribonucleotide synthase
VSDLEPITPPACLGVLGGGQLGRYFVIAARTMGYRTMVLEPDPHAPAGGVADEHIVAPYDDDDALLRLGSACAVVTTEFENPPAHALHALAKITAVRPSHEAIAIAQDRRAEKRFLSGIGAPVAPYAIVEHEADLARIDLGFPAIVKTARLGYDGKGQVGVDTVVEVGSAWRELGSVACVVEQRLALDAELSVVLARTATGDCMPYPVAHNTHAGGILDITVVPARVPEPLAQRAVDLAAQIATELDYVGVLAVELFVADGELVVNELAPRPHNSGHWTLDAALTSQFEQQVRAVCGLPLGDTRLATPAAAMVNLLGDLWGPGEPDWSAALDAPNAHLHLYGKHEARPGRKMGHLTVTADTPDAASARALACRGHARRDLQLDR